MLSFVNDYSEGADERILQRLLETNREQLPGYGEDRYCLSAKEKIRSACGCPDADIYFLTGGTQTNKIVISSLLAPWQGVVAAESGHIGTHEAGAIENAGHKVLTLPHREGKLMPDTLAQYLRSFYADENHSHMVFPGMVYISWPTEYGTLYSRRELADLYDICREYQIPLYIDGARLCYGLSCSACDLTLPELAALCDVFYIGGTKAGALCGEALVFPKKNTPPQFSTILKMYGALLAKGRLLGIQFDTLFTDNLYLQISKNAIETADVLKEGFRRKGYHFYLDSPTNQIFVILENSRMEALSRQAAFCFWEKLDASHTVVRFATSWATSMQDVEALVQLL